jgi:hypothetical protein
MVTVPIGSLDIEKPRQLRCRQDEEKKSDEKKKKTEFAGLS